MALDREIELRVLGPVRIRAGDAWLGPARPQLRLLAGLLALRAGHVVPVEELIDEIWDDKPPRSARASLQSLVTQLRHLLEQGPGAVLARSGDGYRLELDSARVDVGKFRALARAARAADGLPAIALFDAALALWDGPVLADAADTARAKAIRQGLDREFMSVLQDRLACMLACGRVRDAVAELPDAVARYPLNERLASLLMVSLHKSGQRADALRIFRQIRRRLAAELGVEPGAELQGLHRQILAGGASLTGWAAEPNHAAAALREPDRTADPVAGRIPLVVPHQLPAVPAPFVGRAEELARLDEPAGLAGNPDGGPVVWVIVGSAGVGKSALAAHWAHRVTGSYPDGQLYLNLQGFGPAAQPVTPEQAVRRFLRALGVPSGELPRSLSAQAGLYRSILAGKRMLVVLDNALDAEQVRALLPGTPGCVAVVTSRVDLDGLVVSAGARVINLDVLSPAESRELLVRRLGPARAQAEPEAVDELARPCAGLPLGLAVVAARAAARPRFPLTALAAELGGRARLDALETQDKTSSVREVLSWSYQQLHPPAARMFRLLGLHPGPDISVAAAASLNGTAEPAAFRALAELTRAHVTSEHVPGRFACHDLLHAYAAEQAAASLTADESRSGLLRLADHYLHTAAAAARILYPAREPVELDPPQPGTAPEEIRGRAAALGWFSAEHQVLLAVIGVVAPGSDGRAWKLAAAMTDYLDREGHWHDLAALGQVALTAAKRRGDREGEAHAHIALGTACLRFESYGAAHSHLQSAIALFRDRGAPARQARCHVTIGLVLAAQGRYARARGETEQALSLYRQLGHRAGEANALGDLGWYFAMLGDAASAVTCCIRALDLHHELGNPLGEAYAWHHLGIVRHQLGDDATAAACYRSALGLLQEVTDRPKQATVLTHLGDTYRAAGNQEMARGTWQQAVAILDELGDLSAEGLRTRLAGLNGEAPGAPPRLREPVAGNQSWLLPERAVPAGGETQSKNPFGIIFGSNEREDDRLAGPGRAAAPALDEGDGRRDGPHDPRDVRFRGRGAAG
jgi:DNA-binding SARP family transcriptional activator/tetratricopeptide (TPR) repeat protein